MTLVGHTEPGQVPVTTQVAEHRLRVTAPVTATVLGGLVLALAAATLTLEPAHASLRTREQGG